MSWYRDNFLLANTEKFQCLTINPRNIDSDKQTKALQIEDEIITNTSQIKLLGVEIDDKLNFTSHISNTCIKASQKVGVLLRLRNLIPKTDYLQIIHPASLNILPSGISHFLTAATKFSCCSSNKKMSSFFLSLALAVCHPFSR